MGQRKQITFERACELFDYHSNGYLVNKVDRGRTAKAGQRVGRPKVKSYRQVQIDGETYREHCVIWLLCTGTWPDVVDHIDHDITNNRVENLRSVRHKDNIRHGSGRQAGLFQSKENGKWQAGIYVDCKRKHLGCFETYEEALSARLKAQEEYWV